MILRKGSKGDRVKAVQIQLNRLGFDCGVADGDFGPKTEAAVRLWEHHTHVTGVLDDEDLKLLEPPKPRNGSHDIPHGRDALVDLYGKPWLDPDGWWRQWGAPANIGLAFLHLVKPRIYGGVRGCYIWVNRDIVDSVESIFGTIADDGLAEHVHSFDGCYNVRRVRRSADAWSTHTWAVAIDINAASNGLGVEPEIHPGIVRVFKEHGWVWGGDFKRLDGMHFQRVTGM